MRPWQDRIWLEANQRFLTAALNDLQTAMQNPGSVHEDLPTAQNIARSMPVAPALMTLASLFGLTPFERNLVLMCAAPELEDRFHVLFGSLQSERGQGYPSFSLALARLPGAAWNALTPQATLRRWRLVELQAGESLVTCPLHIDERILHYLTGVTALDERLTGLVMPVHDQYNLSVVQATCVQKAVFSWSRDLPDACLPVICLTGSETDNQAVAQEICAHMDYGLLRVDASALPLVPGELDGFFYLCQREAMLEHAALLVNAHDLDTIETTRGQAVDRLVETLTVPTILSARERRDIRRRTEILIEVPQMSQNDRRALWQSILKDQPGMESASDTLAAAFHLAAPAVTSAYASAKASADTKTPLTFLTMHEGEAQLIDYLWEACLAQASPNLEGLVQRIVPSARWDSLVLPKAQNDLLHELAGQARQRFRVYEDWGFERRGGCGLGVTALFAGESGTGKTLAAEVLASELRMDLYRVDLSAVVSKYIGETEKNLRRLFDAAEAGGAILLFDEADALFGRRSEIKDSHDRYANIEVSYLLQRMEAYRGVAILTTNQPETLDKAFLRRIRFVVQFPYPDPDLRAEIWKQIFPDKTPCADLDITKLSLLNITGGSIRNIALYAAFLAADAGTPVTMSHLRRAAEVEYGKLERPLTEVNITQWN